MNDSTDRITSSQTAATHQARMLSLLCCPKCQSEIQLIDPVDRGGAIVKADIECAQCGRVGLIDSYRPSFLDRDLLGAEHLPGLVPEQVTLRVAALAACGNWRDEGEGVVGLGTGAQIGGLVTGSAVRFDLVNHAWSGRVRLDFADQSREIDLAADELVTSPVMLSTATAGEHPWAISILDGGATGMDQVILRGLFVYVNADGAAPAEFRPMNLGNPYPARFEEILLGLPPDALVLDLGGGDRRHPDPRVINLEYLPYLRVDLYGDGLLLPFRDNSFDFILSQAVLEHVPDPPRAVSEMKRVLKPGAKIYADFAFMQPLHAVPFHFFNITPHGAKLLFEDFRDVRISSFGGLGVTMRWFFGLMAADQKLEPHVLDGVLYGLDILDSKLSDAELAMLSSGVAVEAFAPDA